jgi:hypothetical protein
VGARCEAWRVVSHIPSHHLPPPPRAAWDRQVFLTYKYGGGSVQKDYDHLIQNFLLSNYESQEGIDNDDGSVSWSEAQGGDGGVGGIFAHGVGAV